VKVWSVLQVVIALWLLRKLLRLLRRLAALAVLAAFGFGAAWLRGWPAARLYRAAAPGRCR